MSDDFVRRRDMAGLHPMVGIMGALWFIFAAITVMVILHAPECNPNEGYAFNFNKRDGVLLFCVEGHR